MMEFRRKMTVAAAVALLAGVAAPSLHAVTDAEMDHARAVAAQWYLRWANNGSDYLDNLSPKSMAELEGKLKAKEKENLKAFKSVKTPSDYASWDKDKLVEYWGVTFFQSAALDEQGKGARNRVKKYVAQINVAEPSAAPAATQQEAAPELPSAAPDAETAAQSSAPVPEAAEIAEQVSAADSAIAADTVVEKVDEKKSSSSTWLYIVALVVLVGVVVWLVIFASKTMQGNADGSESSGEKDTEGEKSRKKSAPEGSEPERRNRSAVYSSVEEDEPAGSEPVYAAPGEKGERQLREKFARTVAAKDEEIRVLHREIHDLREECMRLGEDNGRLTSDLTLAQRELEALRGRLRAANVVTSAASSAPSASVEPTPVARRRTESVRAEGGVPERPRRQESVREIYLGRVNSKGIFVRADRRPVEGKSVFVLTTSDGYTGSYRVLQSAPAIDMALDNPEHYLAGGCVAPDITDTAEADGIRTVTSGTAIFEDGCWRLLRKAKIAYE